MTKVALLELHFSSFAANQESKAKRSACFALLQHELLTKYQPHQRAVCHFSEAMFLKLVDPQRDTFDGNQPVENPNNPSA